MVWAQAFQVLDGNYELSAESDHSSARVRNWDRNSITVITEKGAIEFRGGNTFVSRTL